MFLEIEELRSAMYQYQIEQITEADDDIVYMAISAAIDQAKSYIRPNNKKEWIDGRLLYDADAVFNATGDARNNLLLSMTKTIAKWYLLELCNVDMMYEGAKDRYDRAIAWLKQVNKGDVSLDLPLLASEPTDGTTAKQPFGFGSRTKFNHE